MSLGYRNAGTVHRFRDSEGSLELWANHDVLCARAVGHTSRGSAEIFLSHVADYLERRKRSVVAFMDFALLTGFSPEVKISSASWLLEHRTHFDEIHFYSSAPHVVVAAKSLVYPSGGRMVIHPSADALEGAFQDAVAVVCQVSA